MIWVSNSVASVASAGSLGFMGLLWSVGSVGSVGSVESEKSGWWILLERDFANAERCFWLEWMEWTGEEARVERGDSGDTDCRGQKNVDSSRMRAVFSSHRASFCSQHFYRHQCKNNESTSKTHQNYPFMQTLNKEEKLSREDRDEGKLMAGNCIKAKNFKFDEESWGSIRWLIITINSVMN